jgi:signal transduction histidine kinase/DNA-binding response OmpR family regulator
MYRKFIRIFLFFILLNATPGLAQRATFKIGFSQCVSDDTWRETMEKEMDIELSFYPQLAMIKLDANGNSAQQVRDVKDLVSQGIDLLIISPNESEPLTEIVEEVFQSGIPVIVIDRKIDSEKWTAYIGADNYKIGWQAGKYSINTLKGKGKIVEISGLEGSSPAIERHRGFMDVLKQYPDIEILGTSSGNWTWQGGKQAMEFLLAEGLKPDLVYCHNDFMASGAYQAAISGNRKKDFHLIGIDGLAGTEGGIQYVIDGKLDATFLYPTGGDIAIDVAWKILNRLPYEKINALQTLLIDSTNASTIKIQNGLLASMQEKIERQRQIVGKYRTQISNLRLLSFVISSFSVVVLILILLVVRAYRAKQKANNILEAQKQEIEKQNKKLQKITEQLEIATTQKLRFFTNISHEFRTPLTLLIGPLETMIVDKVIPDKIRIQLDMMYRNALRLLRLINQLMDFRKLENTKMQLQAGNYDIIKFLGDVKTNFDQLAEKQNLKFRFTSSAAMLNVWFDRDKLDKIMFNLLSNAFKFTPEGGRVDIEVKTATRIINGLKKDVVEIVVSDNGRGMSEEHLHKIFERFYQVEQQRQGNYFPGTGLGLSLSKGLIELHSGAIEVQSKKDEGTAFHVFLPLGKDHLKDNEILIDTGDYERPQRRIDTISEEFYYTPQISDSVSEDLEHKIPKTEKQHFILLVEDNPDLLKYMKTSLSSKYEILVAKNGAEAWDIVRRDLPDLVISDIMMPVMDGLELTRNIKTDMKTCHIPVILLTAKVSVENKLDGLEAGADSYIPKPFNEKHLQLRVKKLIELRSKMNDHYRDHHSFENFENPIGRLDKRFLDRTASVIEDNILSQEFGVEELSKEIGISRVHLYRKIKQLTGLSVSEYVRAVKLNKARGLMGRGGMSISEIAYTSGFTSPSYFTKCFKNQYDISPSEYINSLNASQSI